ncbi:hypothetical protein BZG36_03055 [Bifiguratus adelaidae]|uniref:TIGR01456 family HAD hydrolase n=1 Tax=Bifiguratus adelaidae TaxID=1938954 RepID=A0A261XZS1_9FUNG|nr:hypothetical protein BZG36_03055 [Bifiguratus adelaidae]
MAPHVVAATSPLAHPFEFNDYFSKSFPVVRKTNAAKQVRKSQEQTLPSKPVTLSPARKVHHPKAEEQWHTKTAIAFDIDGVLLRGGHVLPEGKRALRMLNGENPKKKKVPHVFITNGGGVTEDKRAADLSKKFGVNILPSQIVQSHTPMKSLVDKYKDQLVLVVGGEGLACREVAKEYGFTKVAVPDDIAHWNSTVWPFRKLHPDYIKEKDSAETEAIAYDFMTEPIAAVLVFHDSRDWGFDMQIIIDVLTSRGGYIGTAQEGDIKQAVPLYFSNPDVIWSTDFPIPRYGQGALRIATGALFKHTTGKDMEYTLFGKPYSTTYAWAETTLENYAKAQGVTLPPREERKVYAIGDNPASDIKGALAQDRWEPILVKTGIAKENDPEYPAPYVMNHVEDAIKFILDKELD